jgi:HPt (histidine-containing phosphotransfer) domain-containing protein
MASETPSAGPIDGDALARIRDAGGDELVVRIIDLWLEGAPRYAERIRAGLARGDAREVACAAHALRGSALNLGVTQVSAVSASVECAAERGDLAVAASEERALGPALEGAETALRGLRG